MGMFGGNKPGGGFDWKAALLAFANPEAGAMYANRRDKEAKYNADMAAQANAHGQTMQALMARGVPREAAATIAADPQRAASFLGGEYETKMVAPGTNLAGRNPTTGAYETQYRGAPRQHVIDGRIVNEDSSVVYDSPYPDITAGPDGSFYQQNRLGVPGQAPQPAPGGQATGGLPPGWQVETPVMGGAGSPPRPFRGGFNPYLPRR